MNNIQHTAATRTTVALTAGSVTANGLVKAAGPELIGRAARPITVALPVFNGERYLARSLTSLLAQEYTDFELVIADNCSSDATEELCREAARRDTRVRYIRRDRNLGVVENHNRLIREADGEFLAFGSSDDEYRPGRLAQLVAALREHPGAVLTFSDSLTVDQHGAVVGGWTNECRTDDVAPAVRLYELFARQHPFLQFYGLMRRSALLRTRLLPPLKNCDRMLLAELVLYGPFVAVPEQLLLWRRHPKQTSEVLDPRSFYAPRRRIVLPNVDEMRWLMGAVAHAPLSLPDRARCYAALRPELRRNARPMLRNLARCGLDLVRPHNQEGDRR